MLELLFIGLLFGIFLAPPIAFMIIMGQKNAKKQAQKILAGEPYEPKKLKGILRTLSTIKDNEGQRLFTKLADFADSHK